MSVAKPDRTSDQELIEQLRSKLIFGNSQEDDPLVALGVISNNPNVRVFIHKSDMTQYDPSVMSLDISSISSLEQYILVAAEIKFCADRATEDDLRRIDDLVSMMEDYVNDYEYSD